MKEVKAYNGQIIKVGETYSFADLWSGDGNEEYSCGDFDTIITKELSKIIENTPEKDGISIDYE